MSAKIDRGELAKFMPSPRAVSAFDQIQTDVANTADALSSASFLTLGASDALGAERILTLAVGDLVGTDGGAGQDYTLGLAATAVAAGQYGDASHLIGMTVDSKGRITSAQVYLLNSDNVTEGTTNLFFTQARARASVSGSGGITYDSTTGIFTLTKASITINGTAVALGGSISVGTVTSVSGTGTVSGLTLTGTVTATGSLTLGGTLDLSSPPAIGATAPAAASFTTARTKVYTVATLPAGTEGMRASVSDATAPTFLGALTGGGTIHCPAYYNGSVWVAG